MLLSTLAAMPVPSPMRPSMICVEREGGDGCERRRIGWLHSGDPRRQEGTSGLNLVPDPRILEGGTLSNGKGVRATGAGARTHLLGADEVVAETAGLLLGQHDNLDGLLGEALLERGRRGKGAEGQSRAFGGSALVFFPVSGARPGSLPRRVDARDAV